MRGRTETGRALVLFCLYFACLLFCISLTWAAPARAQTQNWNATEAYDSTILREPDHNKQPSSGAAAFDVVGLGLEGGLALWRMVAAVACAAGAAALSSAGGIGGGGLYVPIFNLLLGMDSKTAAALSNCMIVGGVLVNVVWYAVQQRRPGGRKLGAQRPLIDYDVALVCQPNVLLGISAGVILNVMSPSWLVNALLVLTLAYMTHRSCNGALRRWRQESSAAHFSNSASVAPPPPSPSPCSNGTSAPPAEALEAPLLPEATHHHPQYPALKMGLLALVWLFFLAVQLARGTSDGQNLFNIETCGAIYWLVTVSQIPLAFILTALTHIYLRKFGEDDPVDAEDDILKAKSVMRLLPFGALFAGVLGGMLGLGGGMIISPLLLEIGMHPQVTAATCSFMVFFSSSLSVVQYWLLGRIPLEYACFFATLALVFSVIGLQVVQRVISTYGRVSLIVFSVGAVMGISAVLMAFFGSLDIWEQIQQGSYMGFRSPC